VPTDEPTDEPNGVSAPPGVELVSDVRAPSLAKTGAVPAAATDAEMSSIHVANRIVIVFTLASTFDIVAAPYRATPGVVVCCGALLPPSSVRAPRAVRFTAESVLSSHKTNCHNRLDRMDDCNFSGNRRRAHRQRTDPRHHPQNTART
jgi:hypothetical protein